MNKQLELVEDKKDDQRMTGSVRRHHGGDGRLNAVRNSPVDGHEFLSDVVGSGASAALAADYPRAMNSLRDLSLLQVQDTLTILHKLAPSYRRLMPRRPMNHQNQGAGR